MFIIYIYEFSLRNIIILVNIHLGFKAYERLSLDCFLKHYDYVLDFGKANIHFYEKFMGKLIEVRLEKRGLYIII